ncbi:hypothetical protein C1646_755794 [Rhizophagus diaphanus]|nr:hypothetical protein C1646_755794 [Rhizophagus diaphanus] [Rhizophagus sp. MUCL 43196]
MMNADIFYSNNQIDYGEDLCEYIPGLYRLVDFCKDGLVDKTIISMESLKKLCNNMVPLSFKSISDINFTKLNSISLRLIGCYGNHTLIAKLLLNKNIINKKIYDLLVVSQPSMGKSYLRPGIYLLLVNPGLGLIIHWPEIGCYEKNASSKRKINMHRYLTKLTDHQLCFMSDKDLESFDWNSDIDSDDDDFDDDDFEVKKSSDIDSDDDDFEVKKSQEEQDDFKIYPGFEVNLPHHIKVEINNQMKDVSLSPIGGQRLNYFTSSWLMLCRIVIPISTATIIEILSFKKIYFILVVGSTTRQSFITRQLIDTVSHTHKVTSPVSITQFPIDLKNKLKDHYLHFDRHKMNMYELELFVKYGLEVEGEFFFSPLHEALATAKVQHEKKKYQKKSAIVEDIEIMKQIALMKLHSFYSHFDISLSRINISDTDLNRIQTKYPGVETLIEEKNMNTLEKTSKVKENNDGLTKSISETFYDIFIDKESDLHKLMEKYTQRLAFQNSSSACDLFDYYNLNNSKLNKAKQMTKDMADAEFITKLVNSKLFEGYDDIREKINSTFFEEYHQWKKNDFPVEIRKIFPESLFIKQLECKLEKEYVEEKQRIEKNEFENIEMAQPNQTQISIYETSLEQADTHQLQEDEHVPNLTLTSHYSGQYGTSFHLDPQVYDFRKIFQFDNHKFLLVLWNKKASKTEIFLDTAQKLAQNFKQSYSNRPFKTLNTNENYFIAVNEPKELIAIFDTRRVVLNIFSFNDGQANLYSRNSNIQLLQWYSGAVPDIQYFLFIQDTEDLCFVEKSGRAHGSCIVAFVKEKIKVENSTNDANENDEEDNLTDDEQNSTNRESDFKEICRAYVYFCTNFGGSANKVIDLPPTFQSLEYLQFTCINKLQTHLITLDLENGCLNSIIVKITVERNQYRFQNRVQKQSLGLVKISHRNFNYAIIEGKNTRFEKIVKNGEYIVILGEKYSVLEVLSDTELKIDGNFKQKNGLDKWMEFRIEPKTKLNGLIDAYGLMFERYPVESCIDPEQNRPLSLKIVLDFDNDIEKYGKRFEDYIIEMFKNLKRSTKKPSSTLEEFTTSVITFQKLDVENAKFQKKFSPECQLGEWIIQLCCLIPIQIAVTKDNLFQPLRDGLSSNDGYGLYVDGIVKNISFGWYEGIFKHFGDKKVKVVSSMGEQSCGKSFMLNHLVGTTFDGSAMRCTEGVWMSLVNTKKYICVALDFESLRSFVRTPQEDFFLTLFNAVVSNLILFKNQFAVNRDMSIMFRKFQDGAMLFESDSEIFQAKLCIIIKDVPSADKEDIVREFKMKFSQLVSEEGEDNFISRMYKGGLDIIPWPMTFLQYTKVIMAKLKICDLGSLDEFLIQIRTATLKRLLPTVVAYESRFWLSDILSDYEGSTKILPDSDIQLYDEHESFERLSEDLRCYFEDHVQPRKESSNDREWFANFEKFFKYIIERRILRVQNWYMQNTAKFPQDNRNVVNGKYEMEQELIKLTLLWTLCGLTCHQCGLKCVKNRDHQENHDCLTDHKSHNDNLIPKCSHKADHEGKHACDKISHLCGEPCSLNDKRNCQKVCSKEIGHDDREHLCRSTIHYCGKDCSLSTYTQKGDYQCLNKCVKPYEEEHDSHHCENTICPIQCPIPNCKERCQSDDHFHAFSDLQVNHFCGNEHQCRELCEDDGICQVVTEPKKLEETYKGLVKETSITFTKV